MSELAVPDDSLWRKSSYSSGGECVEVGSSSDGLVFVRNSNSPARGALVFLPDGFREFLMGAKAGEFDDLAN